MKSKHSGKNEIWAFLLHIFHLSSGSLFLGDFLNIPRFPLCSNSWILCAGNHHLIFTCFLIFFHFHNILILWINVFCPGIVNETPGVSCSYYSCAFFVDLVAWTQLRRKSWINYLSAVLCGSSFPCGLHSWMGRQAGSGDIRGTCWLSGFTLMGVIWWSGSQIPEFI